MQRQEKKKDYFLTKEGKEKKLFHKIHLVWLSGASYLLAIVIKMIIYLWKIKSFSKSTINNFKNILLHKNGIDWQVILYFLIIYSCVFVLLNLRYFYIRYKKGNKVPILVGDKNAKWQTLQEALLNYQFVPYSQKDKYANKGLVISSFIIPKSKKHNELFFEMFNLKNKIYEDKKDTNPPRKKRRRIKLLEKQIVKLSFYIDKKIGQKMIEKRSYDRSLDKPEGWNLDKYEIIYILEINGPHSIALGATGAGKSQTIIIPSLDLLSSGTYENSFVITDIKGELYDKTSPDLKAKGYKILLINFIDATNTHQWDPLQVVVKMWMTKIEKTKELLKYKNMVEKRLDGWEDVKHHLKSDSELRIELALIESYIDEGISGVASSIFTADGSGEDKQWQGYAQKLFIASTWLMLEELENKEFGILEPKKKPNEEIRPEHINLNNIRTIGTGSSPAKLIEHYNGKIVQENGMAKVVVSNNIAISKSYKDMSAQVINNAPNTLGSIITTFDGSMDVVNRVNARAISSGEGYDLSQIGMEKTAVFILIPDQSPIYNKFGSLLISQIYIAAVNQANEWPSKKVPVTINMFLDEFGNFPKILNLDVIFSVARSRGILLNIVIQDFAQIVEKYGQNILPIVASQVKTTIFLSSSNNETLRNMSDRLGNIKRNYQADGTSLIGRDKNTNQILQSEVPLMTLEELASISKNEGVTMQLQAHPLQSLFIPSYWIWDAKGIKDPQGIRFKTEVLDEVAWKMKYGWFFTDKYVNKYGVDEDVETSQPKTETNVSKISPTDFGLLKQKIKEKDETKQIQTEDKINLEFVNAGVNLLRKENDSIVKDDMENEKMEKIVVSDNESTIKIPPKKSSLKSSAIDFTSAFKKSSEALKEKKEDEDE